MSKQEQEAVSLSDMKFDLGEQLNEAMQRPETREKLEERAREIGSEMAQQIADDLECYGAEWLSHTAASMASSVLDAIINGDERALKRLLGTHRDEGRIIAVDLPSNKRADLSRSAETLRRIVEAHADLLKEQRMADLEEENAALRRLVELPRGHTNAIVHAPELRAAAQDCADDLSRLLAGISPQRQAELEADYFPTHGGEAQFKRLLRLRKVLAEIEGKE